MKAYSLALFRPAEGEHRHDDGHIYFAHYLPAVLRAVAVQFPGWQVVIHHDETIDTTYYGSTLKLLAAQGNIKLVYCGPVAALCHAMMWRLLPVIERTHEYCVCRDLDSLPTPRERFAVEDWIASGKCMHVMHDHKHHANPAYAHFIPGGMCGFKADEWHRLTGIRDLKQMLSFALGRVINLHAKGDDQIVINEMLPPLIGDSVCFHPWDESVGHCRPPTRLLADVPIDATHGGNGLCEYTGGVFNIGSAVHFYDQFDAVYHIQEAERVTRERPIPDA